jgi:hypothetical protein
MPVVDFKEIPTSKGGKVGQDLWALFAREFFEGLHLKTEEGPDRGPDSGRDLIIFEARTGLLGVGIHKWLVSCKHYAHSGDSVSNNNEQNIMDRVRKFKADGFIGFYSTLPSAELSRTFRQFKENIAIDVYDCERIERSLIGNPELKQIFERFFPKSYKKYTQNNVVPKKIGDSYLKIRCNVCNKDLTKERMGRIGIGISVKEGNNTEVVDMYWACIGKCDRIMELRFKKKNLLVSWEGIEDLLIPLVFMHWTITMMNSLREGTWKFSNEAYEKFSEFTFAMSQLVVRKTSSEERDRIESLKSIPFYLGGLDECGTELKHFQP